MKIYTGYWAQISKYREAGLVPVSISRFPPRGYAGARYTKLAPTALMLKMQPAQYDVHFKKILSELNAKKVVSELKFLSDGKDVVLLCFEALGKRCHRHDVKNWLVKNGIKCEEWLVPPKPTFKEQNLF